VIAGLDATRFESFIGEVMEAVNPIYWIMHPLDTSTVVCLLNRSQGRLKYNDQKFETALLIAEECLEYPSLKITEKGKDALRWYFHGSPLIEHLEKPESVQ
jgi:hypothetical protein